jgi:hypothetical protein
METCNAESGENPAVLFASGEVWGKAAHWQMQVHEHAQWLETRFYMTQCFPLLLLLSFTFAPVSLEGLRSVTSSTGQRARLRRPLFFRLTLLGAIFSCEVIGIEDLRPSFGTETSSKALNSSA